MDADSTILKVEMTGVCGTDKHIFKGEASEIRGKSIFPYIGGHEVIGTIVEIGENAARNMDFDHQPLKVGDRVALAVEVNCGDMLVLPASLQQHDLRESGHGLRHPSERGHGSVPSRRVCRVHVHHAGHLAVQDP